MREWVRPEEEVGPQLRRLGGNPADIRWVVLTHRHTDHAGGLHHFPHATILVSAKEYRVAQGWPGQVRGYLPNRWPEWFAPQSVAFEEAPFGPFGRSARLTQAGDIVLVPTAGHTTGHLSVIVRDQGHDQFLAGDASYTEELMLRQHVDGVAPDELAARQTLRNILALAAASPLVYLPSHDPQAAQRLALRQTAALPAVSA